MIKRLLVPAGTFFFGAVVVLAAVSLSPQMASLPFLATPTPTPTVTPTVTLTPTPTLTATSTPTPTATIGEVNSFDDVDYKGNNVKVVEWSDGRVTTIIVATPTPTTTVTPTVTLTPTRAPTPVPPPPPVAAPPPFLNTQIRVSAGRTQSIPLGHLGVGGRAEGSVWASSEVLFYIQGPAGIVSNYGRVVQQDFNVQVWSPGQYNLVFDNSFSIITSKQVSASFRAY